MYMFTHQTYQIILTMNNTCNRLKLKHKEDKDLQINHTKKLAYPTQYINNYDIIDHMFYKSASVFTQKKK